MAEVAPLIRIRDLAYSYPGGPEILRIPALDVSGRGLIAITGPSGAGKSTFVELLAGTLQSGYQGSVEVLGSEWRDLRRDADRQRHLRRIGFIPQDFGLLPDRTPRQMLQQDLTDSGVPPDEHAARIERALSEVDMGGLADQRIASLSGGQGQRVAVARMLARDVDLVIADEPTANLDPDLRETVMGLFRKLSAQVPVLVVTHDAAVAEACDRTIILQATAVTGRSEGASSRPRERRRRKSRTVVLPTILLLILAATGGALYEAHRPTHQASSGSHTRTTPAPTVPPVGVRLLTVAARETSSPKYQVSIPYPQLVSSANPATTKINLVLAAAAQKPIDPFEQEVYNSSNQAPTNELSMLEGTASTNVLDSSYASFSLNISQFDGGDAHPFATVETFNFDEKTGDLVSLSSLFQPGSDWLTVLSNESRALLGKVLPPDSYFSPGSGTTPAAANFAAWALTPFGLSIQFQEYQVAPYSEGQPMVLIPFAALQPILAPNSPLEALEKSPPLRSILLPASVAPSVDECTTPVPSENDFEPPPGPLRCPNGGLNVQAWYLYAIGTPALIGAGPRATVATVTQAMCREYRSFGSYGDAYTVSAEKLAALYYDWRFGVSATKKFPGDCSTLTGLRRDFRPGDPTQASDLGKLWISPDFRARM